MDRPKATELRIRKRLVILHGHKYIVKMQSPTTCDAQNKAGLMRLSQVVAATGWPRKYIAKLVKCGTLKCYKPDPSMRAWYYRKQINFILNHE